MAISYSSVSDFTQEERFADLLWSTTASIAQTLNMNDCVDVLANVKEDNTKLPALAVTATWQDGSGCGFSASGDDTMSQDTLTVVPVKVNKQYCVRDWEAKFTAGYLDPGQHYEGLGALESYLVSEILKANGKQFENFIWRDSTATGGSPGFADGVIKQVEDGSATATSTGSISSSNALGYVDGLVSAAMADQDWAQFIADGDVVLYLGGDAMWNYEINFQSSRGANTYTTAKGQNRMIEGTNIPFKVAPGLTGQNSMYLMRKGQLVVGTDLLSDLGEIDIYPDADKEYTRAKLRFKAGALVRDVDNLFFHAAS